jgi:hypothetical protein
LADHSNDHERDAHRKDKERAARVMQAFLKMKKFDIAALKRAYEGK